MKYKDNLRKKIREYCEVYYPKLKTEDFQLGDNPYNRRCHLNSVQKIKEGKATEIYLCIAWDKDDLIPCIHFINKLENGKYQDNTWGWLYEQSIYYIIRRVNAYEYNNIWTLLNKAKEQILNNNSSKFLNWIHRVNKEFI